MAKETEGGALKKRDLFKGIVSQDFVACSLVSVD
jgi:hypothetical protein